MFPRSIKRCFTLLEVLLVMGLVALVAGFAAINVRKAVREQEFLGDVSAVLDILRLAQQLMIILNTDVKVKFTNMPDNKGVNYSLDFEDQLNQGWRRELLRKRKPLKLLLSFKSAEGKPSDNQGEIVLRFFSIGSVMSKGMLRLSSDTFERYICLPGYPHFFQSQTEPNRDLDCNFGEQKAAEAQLTQLTIQEVSPYL
jgi:type II secretory pathway pseudopilin PulG